MAHPVVIHQNGNSLCATERARLFAHEEKLQTVTSQIGLSDCLQSLRDWLELDEIVVATGTTDALTNIQFTGSGYDPQWMALYVREKFMFVDPIVRAILDGNRFVDRTQVPPPGLPAPPARTRRAPALDRFLEAARDYDRPSYGYASGIILNGHLAFCSMITDPGHSNRHASLVLRTLRPALYQSLMRILLPEPAFPRLSERELAILECLAMGHNDTQIADMLSISASTVRFHLGNVFDKLGAHNRCHAVAIGFQTGLLQR